ncbi:AAA family ATPase [Ferruginibacter sp. SUN106]|uniref:AAA family ATPase n=1 Tax=Ferruginibacter sp. SUN106 TaxID=2978348 RepID=UPI003D35A61A
MSRPFNYGKLAENDYFTNRTKEMKWLEMQISTGINCILVSPRRWGKSSLLLHTANEMKRKNKKIIFCFLDLYNIRTEKEFLELFSSVVIKAASNSFEDAVRNVKGIFKQLIPSVSISPDPNAEIELSFNWKDLKKNISEILDLPEKIAAQKNVQVVVCVDEFQNISFMEDGIAFQKKLRAHWQKHQKANYVLYGSRRHLMMDFFTKNTMPFYRFGEILFLEKIEETHWIPYIIGRFEATNKKISASLASKIARQMNNHPYYVQQLSQVVWQQTTKTATEFNFLEAIEELLDQYTILYQKEVDILTNYQLNFLKALCNKETSFGSTAVLQGYNLGTSANITRIKAALQNHEIIDVLGKQITFNDPLFEIWLMKRFFKISLQ